MFMQLLMERRSIRNFQDKEIEGEKIQSLLQAGLLSPTSRGSKPWQLIQIDSKDILQKLSEAKAGGSSFVAGAKMAIVVAADPEVSDVWIEDSAIAALNIHLEASDLELGSCWVQIRKRQRQDGSDSEAYVKEVLGLPDNLRVDSIIALGYPAEEKPEHDLDDLPYDQVHYNKYGQEIPD
ncbi:MAG: nitroreductase family protein [Bacillota bacterium]